ncbi:MAG: hypothetical protein AB1442_13655 [Nitrospirota bacterium]
MVKRVLVLVACFLLMGVNAFAGNGDLIVNGKAGIGTTSTAAGKLYVKSTEIGTPGAIQIDTPGQSQIEFLSNGLQIWALIGTGNGNAGFYYFPTAAIHFFMTPAGWLGLGYTNPGYKLHVNGSFSAVTKYFDIPDPRYKDESQRLIHSSLEGPEIGVFYRGEAKIEKGEAVVALPDYFEALTRKEGRTVLLTPKFEAADEPVSNLAASAVADGKFSVRAIDSMNPEQSFYWEVKAVRSDVEQLRVEEKDKDYDKNKDIWKPK